MILISSSLSSMPLYTMSSISTIKKMDTTIKIFLARRKAEKEISPSQMGKGNESQRKGRIGHQRSEKNEH